jgi:hypothetical protein
MYMSNAKQDHYSHLNLSRRLFKTAGCKAMHALRTNNSESTYYRFGSRPRR